MRISKALLLLTAAALLASVSGCSEQETGLAERLAAADESFQARAYEEAGAEYEAIADEALAAGDTTAYVEACAMRARTHLIAGRAEDGRRWLEKSTARADATDPPGWSRYLGVRGRFEWQDDRDPEKASETFREMFDYCSSREQWDRAVDAAHMVALTGSPEERFEWARRGIAVADSGGLEGWLGPLWNNLGWDYIDAGRYEEALDALERAREYHYRSGDSLSELIADYSVAHAKMKLGRLADAKLAMRDVFDRAERMHEKGSPNGIEWMGMSRWDLGEIALAEGETGVAVDLMSTALGELEEAGMPNWAPDDYAERQARLEEIGS
jgi:tetratricopeptide (TPR) repeat protein